MSGNTSEQHRRDTEARFWLAMTCGSRDKVKILIDRITKIRGEAAAEKLHSDMQQQWKSNRRAKNVKN